MVEWLLGTVPLFKAVHIAGLVLWCGGLLALPLMLARHDPAISPADYRLVRRATHITYTICATPAAVVTVIAGTWLIFMRGTFVPWFYAKLLFVALLVVAHAWTGHLLQQVAERPGRHRPPSPYGPMAAVLVPIVVILLLVLAKPDLGEIEPPTWLTEPVGAQLPFVPS